MWLNGCRNLTEFVSCDIWSDRSSDDETAGSTEAPAQYQQLPIEDSSTRIVLVQVAKKGHIRKKFISVSGIMY